MAGPKALDKRKQEQKL